MSPAHPSRLSGATFMQPPRSTMVTQVAWATLARSGRDDATIEMVARMIVIGERGK